MRKTNLFIMIIVIIINKLKVEYHFQIHQKRINNLIEYYI